MRVTEDRGNCAVVASMGGAPNHSVWYLNLVADPTVSLQDGAELKDSTARVVDGDEKVESWNRATDVLPSYDDYQANTDRVVPLIVLEPS